MNITYFDTKTVTDRAITKGVNDLEKYRKKVLKIVNGGDFTKAESSLATWQDEATLEAVYALQPHFKKVKHVVVVGIGGSSLGTEAIHSVLAIEKSPQLHILDTVSAFELQQLLSALKGVKKAEQIAICAISKSGGTTETLANTSVLLEALEDQLGKVVYKQVVYIGNPGNDLLKAGKKLGGHVVPMQESIGGRYSVFTSVGLVPLMLLGHDIEAILNGLEDATAEPFEEAVAESAARLYAYLQKGTNSVNFFAFDTRLVRLGKWYRQLTAESLGKEFDTKKQPVKEGFIPTISTPVELHSIGQLYFSKFPNVYTDFVSFDDEVHDFEVSKKTKIAPKLKGKSLQEISTAIYGGVVGAYQAQELPYRATLLEDDLAYSLGLFMGMRMLETMYVANLMGVNAFNQPNVELYKDKTRKILKM